MCRKEREESPRIEKGLMEGWRSGLTRVGCPRDDTHDVGFPTLGRSPMPSSESRTPEGAAAALLLRTLHIPRILYAQLRINNQESKQGCSRQPCPARAASRARKQPPSVKLAQTSEPGTSVGGMRKARSGDKCVSLCSTKTKRVQRAGRGVGSGKKRRGQGQSRGNVRSQKTWAIIS